MKDAGLLRQDSWRRQREAVDAAIARGVREEVGVSLSTDHYIPLDIISLTSINQVYVSFLVRLDQCVSLAPLVPEALNAKMVSRGPVSCRGYVAAGADDDVSWLFQARTHRSIRFLPPDGPASSHVGGAHATRDKSPR